MRDVLWPESARRRALVERFVELAGRAGYREVVPPLLEELGVFTRLGEGTEVVAKEMYDFEDKDGTRIALRPEMTAGIVRAFVQNRPPLPWKVFYTGSNFRHENPQRGRLRSFDQVGVEALGSDDPDLDVEVIALAWRFFEGLGLSDVRLLVNSLGDTEDRTRYTEAVRAYFEAHSAELSELSRATLERNPLRVLDSKRDDDREVVAGAPRMPEHLGEGAKAHFERVLAGLDALGIPFERDDRLVRGLDYYRRTTFELVDDALDSAQNAIGGGGRYDGLAEDLGGPPTDGIGFAIGVDRTLLACDDEGVFPTPGPELDVYVVDVTGGDAARDLTHELRDAGFSADRRFGGGSMKAQMKAADRSGARFALLVGSEELEQGEVTLRRLRGQGDGDPEGGRQRRVARSDLLQALVAETDTTAAAAAVPETAEEAGE